MSIKFYQQWRDGGRIETRTRTQEWILANLIRTKESKVEEYGAEYAHLLEDDISSEFAISTDHTVLDLEKADGVYVRYKGVGDYIRQTSVQEALAQMAAIEELYATGLTTAQVIAQVEIV